MECIAGSLLGGVASNLGPSGIDVEGNIEASREAEIATAEEDLEAQLVRTTEALDVATLNAAIEAYNAKQTGGVQAFAQPNVSPGWLGL